MEYRLRRPVAQDHRDGVESHRFRFEFELDELPTEPGLIIIRGPRQYGKSTWLDMNLRRSVQEFGKGSSYYLNGDEISTMSPVDEMTGLYSAYSRDTKVKRLFIDEIIAVPNWGKAVKRVIDQGLFRDVLIITTGSKASDLRHGAERLPGRKGKLPKNEYIFFQYPIVSSNSTLRIYMEIKRGSHTY